MNQMAPLATEEGYNFAFLDEQTKRMIRRAILKAVAIPGHQIPFGSREMPLSYGWGWWWFSNIEFRDEKVVLYSTYLPAGTYEYVYSIRAGLPGTYNVIPASGSQFYMPEVFGRSAGSTFTILPAE